jgi:putative flippase GtrA
MQIDLRRWSAFSLVGFGGFILQIGAIALLTRRFEWPAFAATIVGLELAALQNFVAHSRWTWGDRPELSVRAWLRRYWRYQVAKTASLLANLAITTALSYAGAPTEAANMAAVLVCAIPNYLLSEHLVFRQPG